MTGTPQTYIKTVQSLLADELLDVDPEYPILEQLMFIMEKINQIHDIKLEAEDVGLAIHRLLKLKSHRHLEVIFAENLSNLLKPEAVHEIKQDYSDYLIKRSQYKSFNPDSEDQAKDIIERLEQTSNYKELKKRYGKE
jgi:hypothetical protein